MCVVSMVTRDFYRDYIMPNAVPFPNATYYEKVVTRAEFEKLKEQFEQLAKDIAKAKQQDIDDGNPDCEKEESIELLKAIAEKLGVNLEL